MAFSKNNPLLALILILAFVGIIRHVSDNPYEDSARLTAQVEGAFSPTEVITLTTRANTLSKMLEGLAGRISALQTRKPILTNSIQLIGTGSDEGYTTASFGTLAPGDAPRSITVAVKNNLSAPALFSKVNNLSGAFSFKGGMYPGTGGTCGTTIPRTGCTMVFQYAPTEQTAGTNIGSIVRHLAWISLEALPSSDDLEETSNQFGLTGYVQAQTVESVAGDLIAELFNQPSSILPGELASFFVRVGLKDKLDTRPVFFKEVTLSGLNQPFLVEKNECADKAIIEGSCLLRLSFKPAAAGTFRQTFTVSFDAGLPSLSTFNLEVIGYALPNAGDLDASKHVLVVYNQDWQESVETKNYYLANRPGFLNANTLSIHFSVPSNCSDISCLARALEIVSYAELRAKLVEPIISWLRAHPEKDIRYIVLMRGIPTRSPGSDTNVVAYRSGDPMQSAQYLVYKSVADEFAKEVFPTSLDMGSLESTRHYIDKIKAVYSFMPVKAVLVSARGTPFEGSTYYLSDAQRQFDKKGEERAKAVMTTLRTAYPALPLSYKAYEETPISIAPDVAGFFSWGIYEYKNGTGPGGWNGDYSINGTVRFSGKSGWYLIQTVESFNGLWQAAGHQGNFIKWFSPRAFGGTDYQNTPAAAVTYVIEPSPSGIHSPYLFVCWERGNPFAYCAWKSYVAQGSQAVGDPLVTR